MDIYASLSFPVENAPKDRPYVFINMVTTIDGKITTGERGEPVGDLGSKVDHELMRRIENAADAVLIGAGAQRSTPDLWYPVHLYRFVATRSGKVLTPSRFFADAPERAFVIAGDGASVADVPLGVHVWEFGGGWRELLQRMRAELGITRLLVEGGSDLNAQLLSHDLVDELFLSLAPKVKLGDDTPTYAGGTALPRERVQKYELVEHHRVGDELFMRYRRRT